MRRWDDRRDTHEVKGHEFEPTDSMGAPVVRFFFWPRAQPLLNEPQASLVHVLATIMAAILFTSEAVRTGVLDSSLQYAGSAKSSAPRDAKAHGKIQELPVYSIPSEIEGRRYLLSWPTTRALQLVACVRAAGIDGQMGGTARPGPGTPRHGTTRHGTPGHEKTFVPCRAAQRAGLEAQARH